MALQQLGSSTGTTGSNDTVTKGYGDLLYNRKVAQTYVPASAAGQVDSYGWYNKTPANIQRIRTDIGKANANSQAGPGGTNVVHAVWLGDSMGSDGWDGSQYNTQYGIPLQFRNALSAATGLPIVGSGIVCAIAGGTAGVPSDRWTMSNANTTTYYNWGQAFPGILLIASGAWVQYAFADTGSTVRVYYGDTGSTFTVSVDGATSGTGFATVSPGGTNAIKKVDITGLGESLHTVRITATGNYPYIVGVESVSNQTFGLTLHNIALGGTTAAYGDQTQNWNDSAYGWNISLPSVNYYGFPTARKSMLTLAGVTDPSIVVVSLGNNDKAYGQDTTSTIAGIATTKNYFPNATYLRLQPYTSSSYNDIANYLGQVYLQADSLKYPLLDWQARIGDLATAVSAGYIGSDNIHPRKEQEIIIGRALAQIVDLDFESTDTASNSQLLARTSNPTTIITASFTAVAGGYYNVDTTSAAITATLPTAPRNGTKVFFANVGTANALTCTRGGTIDTIDGGTTNTIMYGETCELTYNSSTQSWIQRRFLWNPTAGTNVRRDPNGRSQVADPVATQDVATLGWVNNRKTTQVNAYTTPGSGTYTIPAWATVIKGMVWGAGGGGGGGSRNAVTTSHSGGAGGAGGGYSEREWLASDLRTAYPSGIPYTVGAGGTAGAAAAADNSSGGSGGNGGTSVIGSSTTNYFELGCGATGGASGGGGATTVPGQPTPGIGTNASGGTAGTSSLTATAGPGISGAFGGGSGGGGGGGFGSTTNYYAGGAGNAAVGLSNYGAGGAGAATGSAGAGGAGGYGNKTGPTLTIPIVGGSGGGGGSSGAAAAGAGGVGGMASGGGGGGATINGNAAGVGGAGGPGCVVFIARP